MHRGSVFYRRFGVCAAVAVALGLVAAPLAQGQATVAATDEYVAQQPGAGGGTGGAGGQGGDEAQGIEGTQAGAGQGAAGTVAQSGGGALPFTGYPMSTLVWIVLALVLTGIAIRLGAATHQRLQRTEPQTP